MKITTERLDQASKTNFISGYCYYNKCANKTYKYFIVANTFVVSYCEKHSNRLPAYFEELSVKDLFYVKINENTNMW